MANRDLDVKVASDRLDKDYFCRYSPGVERGAFGRHPAVGLEMERAAVVLRLNVALEPSGAFDVAPGEAVERGRLALRHEPQHATRVEAARLQRPASLGPQEGYIPSRMRARSCACAWYVVKNRPARSGAAAPSASAPCLRCSRRSRRTVAGRRRTGRREARCGSGSGAAPRARRMMKHARKRCPIDADTAKPMSSSSSHALLFTSFFAAVSVVEESFALAAAVLFALLLLPMLVLLLRSRCAKEREAQEV